MNLRWWELIPKGEDSILFLGAADSVAAPLIAFRDAVKTDAGRLDPALRKAFAAFRLLRSGQASACTQPGGVSAEQAFEVSPSACGPLSVIVPPVPLNPKVNLKCRAIPVRTPLL